MADVRVERPQAPSPLGLTAASEDRPRQERRGGGGDRQPHDPPVGGREELAVALGEPGRRLRAELEQDAAGALRVRVVDVARGELVAVLTPDELRSLAEATGLPSGMLFQAKS